MKFSLSTPDDSKKPLSNATKVKIWLTTGIVEILDGHQPLMGKVELDLLEVENYQDNKMEKHKYLIQRAVVSVSANNPQGETYVEVYAKRVLELTASLSLEDFSRKVETKSLRLEYEKQVLADAMGTGTGVEKIKARLILAEEDLDFDKKALALIKESKF